MRSTTRRPRSEFGGLWFDQQDGGAAHHTFTSDLATHRAAISGIVPAGSRVDVSRVEHPMSKLERIKDAIMSDMLPLIRDGMPITMVDANARANRVIVYLS